MHARGLDRSDDYTEPWGVPPNEVPEGLRGKFTGHGGPGNGPVEYHDDHLVGQCCRENIVLKEQVERLTSALADSYLTIDGLRRELDSLKEQYDTTGLPGDDSIPIAERRAAKFMLDVLPEYARGFWSPQFQLVPDTGKFMGLSCRVCDTWQEYAHDDDCPVAGLDNLVKGASQ